MSNAYVPMPRKNRPVFALQHQAQFRLNPALLTLRHLVFNIHRVVVRLRQNLVDMVVKPM